MSGPRASRRALLAALTGLLVTALAVSGCQFRGVTSLPLPGGVDTGDDPYTVTVEFADVTELVRQSAVRVDQVKVGEVTDIQLEGWHARVTCRIRGDVHLPDNAVAKVSQTSLLGAKFVRISPPATAEPSGRLSDGDLIPLARTGRYPEVEEVLSALSLLLNGGGLAQLETITKELNAALEGREQRLKDLLRRLDRFVGSLEEQKSEIVRALQGVKRLSARLREQKETLADAVDRIGPALRVLNEQQDQLTKMLVALSDLGKVATEVIDASRADLLANLRNLQPILTRLEEAGAALPKSLELLLTFPFPKTTRQAIKGDYVNLEATAELDLNAVLTNLLGSVPNDRGATGGSGSGPGGRQGSGSRAGGQGGNGSGQGQPSTSPSPPSTPTASPSGSPGSAGGGGAQPPDTPEPGSSSPESGQDDLLDLLLGGGG